MLFCKACMNIPSLFHNSLSDISSIEDVKDKQNELPFLL